MTTCAGSSAKPTIHGGTVRPRSSALEIKATSRRGGISRPLSARSASRRPRSMARTLDTRAGGDAGSKNRTVSARAEVGRSGANTARTIATLATLRFHTPQAYLPALTSHRTKGGSRAATQTADHRLTQLSADRRAKQTPAGLPGADRSLAPDELPQLRQW